MLIINGLYSSAKIFTITETEHNIEDYAKAQIQALCDNEAFHNCVIRVMPDVHPGKVGTIGFTSTLGEKILPNVVGIDIGCGISLAKITGRTTEFQKLDRVIKENIPSGFEIRKTAHTKVKDFPFEKLHCRKHIREDKARLSLGSLGGGNHFIEVGKSEMDETYLSIHSGSRQLGKEVTEFYLKEGAKILKSQGKNIPYELVYLEGELKESYLHDLAVVESFAALNRNIMIEEITKGMKWKVLEVFSSSHNYVDFSLKSPILRKGAVSAKKNEVVIIPINMRDGILLGKGLGNPEWNYSAPHGAGRILKREAVKEHFTLASFKKEMKGIYSPSIKKETLDEAPFAYRSLNSILSAIEESVKIDTIIRPIYNFKAG